MPWVRQLPSGKWAATVRLPGDRKLTKTFPLKGQADRWATDQVAGINRGDWIDPREGEITVGTWWERCRDARVLELASRRRDESHWRVHVAPRWGRVPLTAILQPDVSAWVVKMGKDGVGPDTAIGSVKVLRVLLEQAVGARLIRFNPARGVKLPRTAPSEPRVLTPDEDEIVLDAFRQRWGDRSDGALFVEFLMDTGCRWEEAAAVSRGNVDLRRQRVQIAPVMERDGKIREYAKSDTGNRPVPISDELWPRFREHVMTRPAGALVFTSATGGPLNYTRWRARVWVPTFTVVTERGGRNGQKILATRGLLDGEQPTPHDLRHTFATRLAEQGVPHHELMALLGQKDPRATQRYLHAGEDRFERARRALAAARKGSTGAGGS